MSGKYFPELDLNTQVKMVLLYQLVYSNTLIHIWRFSTVRYDSVRLGLRFHCSKFNVADSDDFLWPISDQQSLHVTFW